jgi:hypothetical protein
LDWQAVVRAAAEATEPANRMAARVATLSDAEITWLLGLLKQRWRPRAGLASTTICR